MARTHALSVLVVLSLALGCAQPAARELDVRAEPARTSYSLGERVTLTVHSVGPDGSPEESLPATWTLERPDGRVEEHGEAVSLEVALDAAGWTIATACVDGACERGGVLVRPARFGLVLETPRPGQLFRPEEDVWIRGRIDATEAATRVLVNDEPVRVDADGRFRRLLGAEWFWHERGFRHVEVIATNGFTTERRELDILRASTVPVEHAGGTPRIPVADAYRVAFGSGVLDLHSGPGTTVASLVQTRIGCTRVGGFAIRDDLVVESARVEATELSLGGSPRLRLRIDAHVSTTLGGPESFGTLTWEGVFVSETEDPWWSDSDLTDLGELEREMGALTPSFEAPAAVLEFDADAELRRMAAGLLADAAEAKAREAHREVWEALVGALTADAITADGVAFHASGFDWVSEQALRTRLDVVGPRAAVRRGLDVPIAIEAGGGSRSGRFGVEVGPSLLQALLYLTWSDGALDIELDGARLDAPLPPVLEYRQDEDTFETSRVLVVGAWALHVESEAGEHVLGVRVTQPLAAFDAPGATGLSFDGDPVIALWSREGEAPTEVFFAAREHVTEAWSRVGPELERQLRVPYPRPSVASIVDGCPEGALPLEIELTDRSLPYPPRIGFEASWR